MAEEGTYELKTPRDRIKYSFEPPLNHEHRPERFFREKSKKEYHGSVLSLRHPRLTHERSTQQLNEVFYVGVHYLPGASCLEKPGPEKK